MKKSYYRGLPGTLGLVLSTAGWGWHAETGMHCLRLMVSGLFDRFPRLKIIIGHMGEGLPYFIVRADAFLTQNATHLKRRLSEYFHEHFYITTSGCFSLPPFLCALQVAQCLKPDHLPRSAFMPQIPVGSMIAAHAS